MLGRHFCHLKQCADLATVLVRRAPGGWCPLLPPTLFSLALLGCPSPSPSFLLYSLFFISSWPVSQSFLPLSIHLLGLIQQWVHAQSLQSCLTLCGSMDCNPPGFSVYGILQARIVAWIDMCSSRGSSWLRDQTHFCTAGRFFNRWATGEGQQ